MSSNRQNRVPIVEFQGLKPLVVMSYSKSFETQVNIFLMIVRCQKL